MMNVKIKGIGASKGISVAKVLKIVETKVEINNHKISDVNLELKKFKNAIDKTIKQININKELALKTLGAKKAAIFDAHMQIANDVMIHDEIKSLIENEKFNVLYATKQVGDKYIKMFEVMEDEYMRERASDIKDVSSKIINALANVEEIDFSSISEEVIIAANDLTPSDTIKLNKQFTKGFITNIGGRTSHAAIMARSLEIPAILGLGNITEKVNNGDMVAINGTTGELIINPSLEEIKKIKKEQAIILKNNLEDLKFKGKKSISIDQHEVELAANIGSLKDLKQVIKYDAEGIGLFRTEFLYMDAENWPTEEEQYLAYSEVLKKMNNKKVLIRTLDIGGDKKLNYFEFPKEANPFLGYRAIRMCLDKKDIFQTQLRALLRASIHGKLAIMFPMIATIEELLAAKKELEIAKKQLEKQNLEYSKKIEIGMMIEVPSVVGIAKQFAKHVDFFSIGTNDLMQYTMAADRMNKNVSYLYQPLNPSILNFIKMTIDAAHSENKWIGMCGEMAGNKNAIPLLLGMGLDEFSMSASSILSSRRLISQINFSKAQKLSNKALECDTEKEVYELVKKFNSEES